VPSYYTIIQVVPDPLTDERINVGVIAFDDDGHIEHRVLNNWNRVKAFAGAANVNPVTTSVHGIFDEALTPDVIRSMTTEWRHSVQLTTPRGSLANVKSLAA